LSKEGRVLSRVTVGSWGGAFSYERGTPVGSYLLGKPESCIPNPQSRILKKSMSLKYEPSYRRCWHCRRRCGCCRGASRPSRTPPPRATSRPSTDVLDTPSTVPSTLSNVSDTLGTVLDTLVAVLDTLVTVLDTPFTVLDTPNTVGCRRKCGCCRGRGDVSVIQSTKATKRQDPIRHRGQERRAVSLLIMRPEAS